MIPANKINFWWCYYPKNDIMWLSSKLLFINNLITNIYQQRDEEDKMQNYLLFNGT